ncbi:MAG TPA: hypothetical protein VLD86_03275, partial [Ilumatobacteraceae bacterium]|nr:hypothetical protein [Ilumatobacteraceae bacterium]
MAQVQKVSWRTVGYAALGTAAIIAGTVGIARSDGVRPTALKSNASTRWLVDQVNHRLVLADGLTGRVLARIKTESESSEQVAAQGAGGAFLASPEDGTVRTISTAKLQLGAPQRVDALSDQVDPAAVEFGVGVNGLTVVNASTGEA